MLPGGGMSLFPVVLVDRLGINSYEQSYGQCVAVGVIAYLFASPVSGRHITLWHLTLLSLFIPLQA